MYALSSQIQAYYTSDRCLSICGVLKMGLLRPTAIISVHALFSNFLYGHSVCGDLNHSKIKRKLNG